MGKQFELTLLLQSVVMIVTMFAMLHLCCVFQNTNQISTKQHRLSGEYILQPETDGQQKKKKTQKKKNTKSGNTHFIPKGGVIEKAKMEKLLFCNLVLMKIFLFLSLLNK